MDLEDFASQVDDGNLSDKDDDPNTDEHGVTAHTFEDVEFVIDLSSSKHVEDLEEHEHVEDDREMSGVGGFSQWLIDDISLEVAHHTVEDKWAEEINVATSALDSFVLGVTGSPRWMFLENINADSTFFEKVGLERDVLWIPWNYVSL